MVVRGSRSVQRFGSWLALVALTVQLVLSFGHIHPEDIFPADRPGTGSAQVALGNPLAPGGHQAQHEADDVCAICFTLYMLASASVPVPVQIARPIALRRETIR